VFELREPFERDDVGDVLGSPRGALCGEQIVEADDGAARTSK
jgi:hypothetical protein